MEFITRRMQADDLPAGLRLTQAQNWSHRAEHWALNFRLGRGWVVCDPGGTVLGTALWWAYGAAFGSVGLVVVDTRYQGKGIGRKLMNAVMDDAGARALQLVATDAGLKLYRQCGFLEVGGIAQHQGALSSLASAAVPAGTSLRSVLSSDLASLCELDERAVGGSRRAVIGEMLALGAGAAAERDGRIAGFALSRPSGAVTLVGPVVASDEALARALIGRLLKAHAGTVRIDIPTDCVELAAWLAAANVANVDRVTLMVRGEPPQRSRDARIFGLVSQALG